MTNLWHFWFNVSFRGSSPKPFESLSCSTRLPFNDQISRRFWHKDHKDEENYGDTSSHNRQPKPIYKCSHDESVQILFRLKQLAYFYDGIKKYKFSTHVNSIPKTSIKIITVPNVPRIRFSVTSETYVGTATVNVPPQNPVMNRPK